MTDPPMYIVASAVLCRLLAIVRSLPLPGCGYSYEFINTYATVKIDKPCFRNILSSKTMIQTIIYGLWITIICLSIL